MSPALNTNTGFSSGPQSPTLVKVRPEYPQALYDLIYDFHRSTAEDEDPRWEAALDIGSASSTVAERLALQFELVTGSDCDRDDGQLNSKEEQLKDMGIGNVALRTWCPKTCLASLGPASVDMVTCAEAIHWLDDPKFVTEAKRVLAPGGTLAIWYYRPTGIKSPNSPKAEELYQKQILPHISARRTGARKARHAELSLDHPHLSVGDFTNERHADDNQIEKKNLLRDCAARELRENVRALKVVPENEWHELDEKFAELEELLGGEDARVTQTWALTLILATKKDLAEEAASDSDDSTSSLDESNNYCHLSYGDI